MVVFILQKNNFLTPNMSLGENVVKRGCQIHNLRAEWSKKLKFARCWDVLGVLVISKYIYMTSQTIVNINKVPIKRRAMKKRGLPYLL